MQVDSGYLMSSKEGETLRQMKDSGVEWIGMIPATWTLNKISAIYEERNEKVSDRDFSPLSVTKQGVVPQLETAAKTDNGDNRKLIRKNDFVINSRSDRRGSCGISDYNGSCSLINTVLKPRQNMCNAYYSFVFRSEPFADEFYRWGNGIVDDLWSTKWNNMKRIYIPSPDIEEQQRIAEFLDRKCQRIDAVIARQQEAIEKLKAYKLSVITEAVTKGLNPAVAMKDSGIEWIGQIPAHWYMHKFCWDYSAMLGKMLDAKRVKGNSLHPYIKNADVQWFSINSMDLDEMDFDESETERYSVKAGDLMICEGGEIGKCAIVPVDFPEGIYYQKALHRVRKRTDKSGNIEFLAYLMFVMAKNNCFNTSPEKATIAHLPGDALSQLRIPAPPFEEQCTIVEHLHGKCESIDKAVYYRTEVVQKLTEYKKSLIYEVVTGKREV